MPRRGAPVAEATAPATAEPIQEETVTTVADAPTDNAATDAVTDEAAANAETATEEKAEVDLSGIDAGIATVLATLPTDGSDPDLNTLDFKPVIDAYLLLDRSGKTAATRHLANRSQELLEDSKFIQARVVLRANKATKAEKPKGESKPKEPVNPTEAFVSRLSSIQIAYALVAAGKPDGVAEDWETQVQAAYAANYEAAAALSAYLGNDAEDKGEAPEVSDIAANAVKLAVKPARKAYGPRHDVGKHIEQVFAELESGTFLTAGQIASKPSEEYGPEGSTASAVAARLKGKSALPDGLSVVERDGETGVVKA